MIDDFDVNAFADVQTRSQIIGDVLQHGELRATGISTDPSG
jgi:hypothetical protein